MSKTLFDCPKEGCSRTFQSSASLEQHLTLGNCEYKMETLTLEDKAKVMYSEKVKSMSFGVKGIAVQNKLPGARQTELLQGWALKQKKGRTVF